MLLNIFQITLAFILDLLVGDPPRIPHPVIIIGKAIEKIEYILRKFTYIFFTERIAGILLVMIISGGSYYIIYKTLQIATYINPLLGWLLGTWFISTTIAVKGLAKEGRKIKKLLESGSLSEARKQVGFIVGRDTANLTEKEIIRATVETVSENIVDAVIAPLFYAIIGGPALAMTYRAVNTLDSICGYKNEKYLYFGWASARTDDLFNFIPARITGILLIASAWMLRFDVKGALFIWKRDAHLHPSPNSGIPEAVVAGALGIRLGGTNYYFGLPKKRAYLGDNINDLDLIHITSTIKLLYVTSLLFIVTYILVTGTML